ncbi:MAG: phosphotransferase [Mariprofundaceae bacterium]|nr:phosphotransferase [Mariprofundaceae bacterium]
MSSGDDVRKAQALVWAQTVLNQAVNLLPLAGDASFRRYFRVNSADEQYVLMDAPPNRENVQPFLAVRDWMQQAGLRVPQLIAADAEQGFLLLEDFGDVTWAAYLQADGGPDGNIRPLFADALRQLHLLQTCIPEPPLEAFDVARMQRECELLLDWYLPHVAQHTLRQHERDFFHAKLLPWLEQIAALPRVPVHLDYHSRNLMLPGGNHPPLAVIDFQDAFNGPVTYDLASLLYDCYQDYPEALRRRISGDFFTALPMETSEYFTGFDDWHRALRLTAMQRHIKAIGIFSRLAFRDGKRQFLDEIPLTRKHLGEEIAALGLFSVAEDVVVRRLLIGQTAE